MEFKPLPPRTPQIIWSGGRKAVGIVGRTRNADGPGEGRGLRMCDAISGYAGRRAAARAPGAAKPFTETRKNVNLPFATDDKYRQACPRYKTNSKNVSAFAFGDNRDR